MTLVHTNTNSLKSNYNLYKIVHDSSSSSLSAHSEELAAQVLEVPYAGDAISMLLLLPDVEGEEGFRRVVSALTSGTLLRATQERAHTDTVELFLPRFKLEQMLEDDLKEVRHKLVPALLCN